MSHTHGPSQTTSEKNLFMTMVLNFAITIVEVAGGLFSGSLALLSDALHNLSDGLAIIVTYAALRLSRRPRTLQHTFGLKRAELLAAVINASTLVVISFLLIVEAIDRFSQPTPIAGPMMLAVAVVGLAANVAGTILLKRGSDNNINIRAAYFHLLSDAVSSVGVIIGSVAIIVWNITWVDPVLTILISVYILKETYEILKESVDMMLMSTPDHIDLVELQRVVESVPGVRNLHHVHLWSLNDTDVHFEAHVDVGNVQVSDTATIRSQIAGRLQDTFHITHTTLQFECDSCTTKSLV